jgi:hypothetical protein
MMHGNGSGEDQEARPSLRPVFEGLVFSEAGEPVEVAYVGDVPHYVVVDEGFRWHIPTEKVDRRVLEEFQQQFEDHKEIAIEGVLQMLGRDDLFAKAAVDASIRNMDQLLERGLPADARAWLGMLGFRVVVNFRGDIVRIDQPGMPADWEE